MDHSLTRTPIHTIRLGTRLDEKEKLKHETIKLNQKEFGGPLGVLCLMLLLPLLTIYLVLKASETNPSIFRLPSIPNWRILFDQTSFLILIGWYLAHVAFYSIPIGRLVTGRELIDGTQLQYRCNGFHSFVLSLFAFFVAYYIGFDVTFLHQKSLQLAIASIILSIIITTAIFFKSFFASIVDRSDTGNTGCTVYDYFMGRELNPRIGFVDLKFVFELRPGLIGWILLDWSIFLYSYQKTASINWPLVFVAVSQTIYVGDALYNEAAILSTMDIIHEGFGFMLIFGDLAWVPFTYSLQTQFLVNQGLRKLPCLACLIPIVALFVIGYYIFRVSNSQKDRFRTNPTHPSVKGMESIVTGVKFRRILCDGWWAFVRHPNYLGDILIAASWSLATGFHYLLPYFYLFYLTVLLIFRAKRDHRMNLGKYGSSWTAYCSKVPYQIIPRIL